METFYINGKPILLEDTVYNNGEEANLYISGNTLVKIFKETRRHNIPKIQQDLYAYFMTLDVHKFYLPKNLVYDEAQVFRGYTMDLFPNSEIASHAQRGHVEQIIAELKAIEADVKTLSEAGIQINDMKLNHILYCASQNQLGVIDCGLYQRVDNPNLYNQNRIEMNYYLRQALLWADYEGTKHEMVGCDFPEIYDELDSGNLWLSDILQEESEKYKVNTLEELKHCYQKMKFY